MLNITEELIIDDTVVKMEYHSHQPYSTLTFGVSDEIKIAIRAQDICTLPSESYIYVEGKLIKEDGTSPTVKFINNGFAFLFEEIRYEIAGVPVDRNRNCGITSTMKGYCSFTSDDLKHLDRAGWYEDGETMKVVTEKGYFSGIIPLKLMLGFAEDYNKILVHMSQELILTRAKSDVNALMSSNSTDNKYKLSLNRVSWYMPYVSLSDTQKIRLYKVIRNDTDITIAFRTAELFEHPSLPASTVHNWNVKTSAPNERPRFVIIGFQTDKKDLITGNMSKFDSCNVRSVRVWLNSEVYPYELTNVDFAKNNHILFYDRYLRFKNAYYGDRSQSLFDFHQFTSIAPLYVVDCSKQDESVKSGSVDIRIEIQTTKDFPPKTSAYALIISEKIIEYNTAKNLVRVTS